MTIHMSQKWPKMVVEPDMCSHFYIKTVYTIFFQSGLLLRLQKQSPIVIPSFLDFALQIE